MTRSVNPIEKHTHTIMFKPEFSAKILSGEKFQTIRPPRKREIKAGHTLSLRRWEDKPYRSKQLILRECKAVSCSPITILHDGLYVSDDNVGVVIKLTDSDALKVARADGFDTVEELIKWFDNVHKLPFHGEMIRWDPNT